MTLMKPIAISVLLLLFLGSTACSDRGDDRGVPTGDVAAVSAFEDPGGYRARLEYPATWTRDPDYDLRFSGPDGFVSIVAQEGPGGLEGNVEAIAKHKLAPYGSDPEIESITVDGANAVVIRPSADQHADLRGQVALVVERETPMTIRGERYTYLVIEADSAHFEAIVRSISLRD